MHHRSVTPLTVAIAAAVIATATTWSPAVHAEEPTEVDKDAARTLVQQGDDLMKRDNHEEALKAYRRADDIMGVPTTSIEVARVSLLLGKLVEARAAFEKAADYPARDDEPEPFTKARAEARRQLDLLNPKIPRLEVKVDGLTGEDRAEVTLDGEAIAQAEQLMIDPGSHALVASADGYVTAKKDLLLEEFDQREVTLELRQAPTSLWPMVWAGYGVAAAGAIVGSVTGGMSLSQANEVKESCDSDPNDCPTGIPLESSRTLAHVSTASFVVAGLAAGLGTAGLIISLTADDLADGEQGEDEGVEAALRVGPTSLGLGLRF